jgi:hypothetical protein
MKEQAAPTGLDSFCKSRFYKQDAPDGAINIGSIIPGWIIENWKHNACLFPGSVKADYSSSNFH